MAGDALSPSLKILVVDANRARAAELAETLCQAGYLNVHHVAGGLQLADDVAALEPDVILVDLALPDRDTIEGLRQTSERTPRPVALFAADAEASFVEEAIAAGVSSYHVGGLSAQAVKPVMAAAIALFRRHRQTEEAREAATVEAHERRTIEKAKSILMQQKRMTEPEAYRWLRSTAMRESRKLVLVAIDVIGRGPQ
jgi:two-component system, response regulator / RNA-binding antiterminator